MTVYQTARFQVQEENLDECIAAINEFVAYVREEEAGTLLYTSLQQKDDPTQFIHFFIFKDEAARDIHGKSEAVKRFTDILYPRLVAPVKFSEYFLMTSTKPAP